jgi:imidazoleglycerol-phosphate dehydratase
VYPTVYTETFFREVAKHSGLTIRLEKHRGDNAHHIVEATFKSFARCLRKFMDEVEGSDVESSSSGSNNSTSRAASRARSTKETSIDVALDLDMKDEANSSLEISTGIETLDALFDALAETAEFGTLKCVASGDTWIDDHHTTEDVAITIGQCLNEALGNKAGCNRMGSGSARVNGSEVEVIMDLSNRPYLGYDLDFAGDSIGDLSCEMVEHLFMSITFNGQMTVHLVTKEKGSTDKDLAEAAMRAFGTCLKQCKSIDPRRAGAVASSKGTLSV